MSNYNPPLIDDEKAIHATIVNDQGMVAGPVNAVMYAQGTPSNPIYSNQQVSQSDALIAAQFRRNFLYGYSIFWCIPKPINSSFRLGKLDKEFNSIAVVCQCTTSSRDKPQYMHRMHKVTWRVIHICLSDRVDEFLFGGYSHIHSYTISDMLLLLCISFTH